MSKANKSVLEMNQKLTDSNYPTNRHYYCLMRSCFNNGFCNKVTFFDLPHDTKLKEIWLRNCNRLDILKLNRNKHPSHRVCSVHFTEDMFEDSSRTKLKIGAVPIWDKTSRKSNDAQSNVTVSEKDYGVSTSNKISGNSSLIKNVKLGSETGNNNSQNFANEAGSKLTKQMSDIDLLSLIETPILNEKENTIALEKNILELAYKSVFEDELEEYPSLSSNSNVNETDELKFNKLKSVKQYIKKQNYITKEVHRDKLAPVKPTGEEPEGRRKAKLVINPHALPKTNIMNKRLMKRRLSNTDSTPAYEYLTIQSEEVIDSDPEETIVLNSENTVRHEKSFWSESDSDYSISESDDSDVEIMKMVEDYSFVKEGVPQYQFLKDRKMLKYKKEMRRRRNEICLFKKELATLEDVLKGRRKKL